MTTMPEPRTVVERLEQGITLPAGPSERFSGYGVIGLPFASGHVLGLRRFPASSVGRGYTSVWHRDPGGRWTFYLDAPPQQACPRYFGSAIAEALVCAIDVRWSGAHRFTITILDDVDLWWDVELAGTAATRLVNAVSGALPESLVRDARFLKVMGSAAGVMLRAGHVGFAGRAPNRQLFVNSPRLIWSVRASTASLKREALGCIGPLDRQARLGDFWIPQRGIFTVGDTSFEPFDDARHDATTCSG
jgi:hypothetical protein